MTLTLRNNWQKVCPFFTALWGFTPAQYNPICVLRAAPASIPQNSRIQRLQQMKLQFTQKYLCTDFCVFLDAFLSKDPTKTKSSQGDISVKIGILTLLSCFVQEMVCQLFLGQTFLTQRAHSKYTNFFLGKSCPLPAHHFCPCPQTQVTCPCWVPALQGSLELQPKAQKQKSQHHLSLSELPPR